MGDNFVEYLEDHINLDDPTSNPLGQIFLELYHYTLPLGLADGASVNEIVSYAIEDAASLMKHARADWYPTSSDADLLAKFFLFASVADSGFDRASDIGDDYLAYLPIRTRTADKTHGLLFLNDFDDEPPIPVVSGLK